MGLNYMEIIHLYEIITPRAGMLLDVYTYVKGFKSLHKLNCLEPAALSSLC